MEQFRYAIIDALERHAHTVNSIGSNIRYENVYGF